MGAAPPRDDAQAAAAFFSKTLRDQMWAGPRAAGRADLKAKLAAGVRQLRQRQLAPIMPDAAIDALAAEAISESNGGFAVDTDTIGWKLARRWVGLA